MNIHLPYFFVVLLNCVFIGLFSSGCSTNNANISLNNTDEYKVANQIQIHSYAFEKGDIDWFMSTFRKSKSTSLIIDNSKTESWRNIRAFYSELMNKNPHGKIESSKLNLNKINQNSIDLTGSQIHSSESGELLKSFLFECSFQKFRGRWLITKLKLSTNPDS